MIVKNGALVLAGGVAGRTEPTYSGKLTDLDGETNTQTETIRLYQVVTSESYNGILMRLGSGTTEPTAEDYNLDNPIDSSKYSCISAGGSSTNGTVVIDDNGDLLLTYVFRVDDDIEVNEIALIAHTSNGLYMLARQIVPTRTAAYGDLISFTYVIKCGGD